MLSTRLSAVPSRRRARALTRQRSGTAGRDGRTDGRTHPCTRRPTPRAPESPPAVGPLPEPPTGGASSTCARPPRPRWPRGQRSERATAARTVAGAAAAARRRCVDERAGARALLEEVGGAAAARRRKKVGRRGRAHDARPRRDCSCVQERPPNREEARRGGRGAKSAGCAASRRRECALPSPIARYLPNRREEVG